MRPLRHLDLATLMGRWHVVATTLGFWRGREDPTITYEPRPDGAWTDIVSYRKGSSSSTLRGISTPDPATSGAFVWRGTGWLGWCSSRWCFVDADPDEGWALTWFSAATFHVTPEGSDVYARRPDLSRDEVRRILARVEQALGHPAGKDWFLTRRAGQLGGGEVV